MFKYADKPAFWYKRAYVPAGRLCREVHIEYRRLLHELAHFPDIDVYVLARGVRSSYYVSEYQAEIVRWRLGGVCARSMRQMRNPARAKGPLLTTKCPMCGKTDRQWRRGHTRAGKRSVHCGYCKRQYTLGARPRLDTVCPHCRTQEDQLRHMQHPDRLEVRCGSCRRCYTVRPNPDVEQANLESQFGRVLRSPKDDW